MDINEIIEQRILACPPTNINEVMEAAGLPDRYLPSGDATVVNCDQCHEPVWVGANQLAQRARDTAHVYVLWCFTCCADHMRAVAVDPSYSDVSVTIRDLGGAGPARHTVN